MKMELFSLMKSVMMAILSMVMAAQPTVRLRNAVTVFCNDHCKFQTLVQ